MRVLSVSLTEEIVCIIGIKFPLIKRAYNYSPQHVKPNHVQTEKMTKQKNSKNANWSRKLNW